MQLFMLVVLFTGFTGVYSVVLPPDEKELNSLEDTTATLSFRLSQNAEINDNFFWYRQYPGEPPQFLLYISGLGINKTAESLGSDKRFSTELTKEKTGVDLKISSVAVTDSALYYCALRPTVTGNTDSLYKNLPSTNHTSRLPETKFPKERFDAQIQNTSVPLRIQNLQLSDSALYYCALRPTVTGNTDSLYKHLTRNLRRICQCVQLLFRGGTLEEVSNSKQALKYFINMFDVGVFNSWYHEENKALLELNTMQFLLLL
ncbi:unnamed protein product [Arctogadus glacialis]